MGSAHTSQGGHTENVGAVLPPVAILAGGMATRLRPITETIPKAMVPVAGEPFVDHQLRQLAAEGITKVVILIGYKGQQIEKHVGDGRRFGLDVQYSYDGEKLLGTGGAIVRALHLLGGEFFVLYGDSYLSVNYRKTFEEFRRAGTQGLMTVFRNEGHWDTSNVVFDPAKSVVVQHSKENRNKDMHYIDYGVGILKRAVFERESPKAVIDLSHIYGRLAAAGQLAGLEVFERFYEVGSHGGLADLEAKLRGAKQG